MNKPIEERLAECPVRGVIEVIDAREEIVRLKAALKEANRAAHLFQKELIHTAGKFDKCPNCGWPNGGCCG